MKRVFKKLLATTMVLIMVLSILTINTAQSTSASSESTADKAPKIDVQLLKADKNGMYTEAKTKPDKIQIKMDITDFAKGKVKYENEEYDRVMLPGWFSNSEAGTPELPVKVFMFEIPDEGNPSVVVSQKSEKKYEGINIAPAQKPHADSSKYEFDVEVFEKDAALYQTDALFPKSNIVNTSVAFMRDHKVLVVEVTPFQVNPKTETLYVSEHMKIDINMDKKSSILTPAVESGLDSMQYDTAMAQGIYGYESSLAEATPKYMILMDDQFADNAKLSEFVQWKIQKGNDVVQVKTSQIPAATSGAPTVDEIVAYMRGLPSADYPTYLLIIGDHTNANGVAGRYYSTYYGGYTDLDASCRTSSDWLPDLFCGRLPATNTSEATLMLDKVLAMDKNPPSTDMYDKILVAGQIQDSDYNNVADRLFCETADGIACYFEKDAGGVDYDCVRAIVNPHGVTADCKWQQSYPILWSGATGDAAKIGTRVYNTFVSETEARNRITSNINAGVAIVQHRDHGAVTGWGDPSFSNSDVSALSNGTNRPLVLSINCLTGSYHKSNCFAKAWLTDSNGGAYAVVAATDVSYSGYNDWLTHGFYMAFLSDYRTWHNNSTSPNWTGNLPTPTTSGEGVSTKLGQMLNFGKMYMYQKYGSSTTCKNEFKMFHLFGDPEASVQLHAPASNTISAPSSITATETPSTITVQTHSDGVGSQVCLYSKELGVHQVKYVGADKKVDFNVTLPGKGTLEVTVIKFGQKPYKGTINVK